MKNVILKKENGRVTQVKKTTKLVKEIKGEEIPHLCWQYCENACAGKCEKVADLVKHEIGDYNFITDGYQIINEEGKIDNFIVSKCDNYEKTTPRTKTAEEKERLRKIKEGLRMAYFDAGSVQEAYIIQYELEKRGKLKNIRGRRPNEQQIKTMIYGKRVR